MKEQLKNSRHLLFTALLRILVFLVIAIILFALGLMIGYAVLGEGKNPLDIFSKEIWDKIFRFINQEAYKLTFIDYSSRLKQILDLEEVV